MPSRRLAACQVELDKWGTHAPRGVRRPQAALRLESQSAWFDWRYAATSVA